MSIRRPDESRILVGGKNYSSLHLFMFCFGLGFLFSLLLFRGSCSMQYLIHYGAKANLQLTGVLVQLPKCWEYKSMRHQVQLKFLVLDFVNGVCGSCCLREFQVGLIVARQQIQKTQKTTSIPPHLLPKCWDYRYLPPRPVYVVLGILGQGILAWTM